MRTVYVLAVVATGLAAPGRRRLPGPPFPEAAAITWRTLPIAAGGRSWLGRSRPSWVRRGL